MTYNEFGGILNLAQSINLITIVQTSSKASEMSRTPRFSTFSSLAATEFISYTNSRRTIWDSPLAECRSPSRRIWSGPELAIQMSTSSRSRCRRVPKFSENFLSEDTSSMTKVSRTCSHFFPAV